MNKQIIRQVQQNGSRFDICFAPEIREALHVKKGDNVSFDIKPDSGIVEMAKVDLNNPDVKESENPGDPENESKDGKETSLVVRSKARRVEPAQEPETKIEFCVNCASENIDVTGNRYYCRDCDALYELTNGAKLVKLNPLKEKTDDFESRLEQVEQGVQDIGERLEAEFAGEANLLDLFVRRELVGAVSGAKADENENPNEVDNENENDDD